MSEDFGVGFGSKITITVPNQLIFQRLVIFDHSVVHECQFPSRVEMRMGVLVRWLSMRRPPSVAYTESSVRRFFRHEFSQLSDSPGALARFDAIAVNDRNPRGIVTAIFQAAQPIEQDGSCLRTSDVSDNATHAEESVTLRRDRRNQPQVRKKVDGSRGNLH